MRANDRIPWTVSLRVYDDSESEERVSNYA